MTNREFINKMNNEEFMFFLLTSPWNKEITLNNFLFEDKAILAWLKQDYNGW